MPLSGAVRPGGSPWRSARSRPRPRSRSVPTQSSQTCDQRLRHLRLRCRNHRPLEATMSAAVRLCGSCRKAVSQHRGGTCRCRRGPPPTRRSSARGAAATSGSSCSSPIRARSGRSSRTSANRSSLRQFRRLLLMVIAARPTLADVPLADQSLSQSSESTARHASRERRARFTSAVIAAEVSRIGTPRGTGCMKISIGPA